VLLEVDRDFVLALISSGARLTLSAVADLLGARNVRILGPQQTRAWLARQFGNDVQPSSSPVLDWWEIPFLTGLPTVVAWELTRRELVVAPTGDPNWIVRLRSEELARVTSAHVGKITPIARIAADNA
jgi:prolyl-tRNA editing enzyme YbaK/EbsC (Cys-tRNA(Pro) deacylase)